MSKPSPYAITTIATALAAALAYALVPSERRIHPGQVAVITGGSTGLGLALAHRFAKAGLKLALAARSADALELARDGLLRANLIAHEDDVLLIPGDLTDRTQCSAVIDRTLTHFGRLDLLINNAGIIEVGPAEDQPLAAYDRAMATNFFAALHTTYAALPHLLERRTGSIVNISSIGGKLAVPHMLPYSASKFALAGFSEGLHAELRSKGIRVTTVCPGLLRTGGEAHAKFVGQTHLEQKWFDWSATTPGIAVSAEYAANRIFNAVSAGRAEITISPQAWLAARIQGLAPETTQWIASLANQYLLPAPANPNGIPEPLADPSPS